MNGINDSPVPKENPDNDFDKTVPALTKYRVLNDECPSDRLKSDQPQEDKKQQSDIKQNNLVSNNPSDSQASRPQIPIRDKNGFYECDGAALSSPCTAILHDRDHEIAMGVNNEQHRTVSEIEAQVDNNLPVHPPDNGVFDNTTHHNSTSIQQVESSDLVPPISQIEEEPVTTLAIGDQEGQAIQSDNVCTTLADTQLNSKRENCDDCNETNDHEEDPLQPVDSEQNSVNLPPLTAVSPQQQLDINVYSPQHDSDEISVDSQPISSPRKQQQIVICDREEEPLQNLASHSSQQLSDTSELKDDPPLCHLDENLIDLLSHVTISSQRQSDADDQREGSSPHLLSDKHSTDNLLPAVSESSQQHPHMGDLDENQPLQEQSDKNSVDLSSCSPNSSKQQLDTGNNCPPRQGKSQVNSMASTQPQQQPCRVGQKEDLLLSTSSINEHSPHAVISLQKSDERSDKDLLACTALLPPPAHVSVTVREKRHRKHRKHHRKKHRQGKRRYLKAQYYCKHEPSHTQPSKSKEPGPANRNDNSCPANKGSKNTEKLDGSGGCKYLQGEQGNLYTQQASSFGGNAGDDDDGDKDRPRQPYSSRRNFHAQHKDLNWILLLLIVLLILCFCTPQQASHNDTELVCSTGQHQTTSLDLKCSHFPDSDLDECTPALFRGGIFSKQRENGGEESASSNIFPEGYSTDHLISEEETPRFMGQGEEMAGLKKLHSKRRQRERPHTTPSASPGPQLDLNVSGEGYPLLMSEPKLFTCPSPDDSSQETSRDYDASQCECTCTPDSVDEHMIFHSNCVFKSSRLTCGPNPNVRHILTDVNVHQHQQSPFLHYVTKFSSTDSSNTTQEHEEDEEQEDDDPPSQFRGPGMVYKKSSGHSEGHTLDSGVGTNSASNQVPTTQIPPVAAASIGTSWRTSLKKDEIVYLRPSTDDIYHSSFQTVLSVEEQTPRLPNYRDELVSIKQFNHKDSSKKELAEVLSLQPPEPLLERREQTLLLLEPSMKIFSYPSPGDESFLDFQDVRGDVCVFVAGSTLYPSRKPSSPIVCSVLTDDTIGRSQRYPLKYFTTKN